MERIKGLRAVVITGIFAFGFSIMTACGGGVTEEQMKQLEDLKQEVASLETKANDLKEEKSNLEQQISERNKQLEECAKMKQETEANLQKLGK